MLVLSMVMRLRPWGVRVVVVAVAKWTAAGDSNDSGTGITTAGAVGCSGWGVGSGSGSATGSGRP